MRHSSTSGHLPLTRDCVALVMLSRVQPAFGGLPADQSSPGIRAFAADAAHHGNLQTRTESDRPGCIVIQTAAFDKLSHMLKRQPVSEPSREDWPKGRAQSQTTLLAMTAPGLKRA
jgi:hypothetical protein